MDANATPFQTRITHFCPPIDACRLPFAIGSATQHRPSAVVDCHNSQDAASVIISKDHMVAVITDGCSSTHPLLEPSCHSSNEVGAKVMAQLISNSVLRIVMKHPRLSEEALLKKLNHQVATALKSLLRTFCGNDPVRRELFIFDFLMTTVIGLVVSDARYLVFHSGDGVVAVNGEINNLDSDAGEYFANDLVVRSDAGNGAPFVSRGSLKSCSVGRTSDLKSIFLATDGLSRLATNHTDVLREFALAVPSQGQAENGFDFLLQEFRQRVAWNPDVRLILDDDATFVLLRRIRTE
jgi:protein phosphatase 2C-like protein